MKYKLTFIILTAAVLGCKSFLKYPPVPAEKMSASDELDYILKTDQRDRKQNMHRIIFYSDARIEKSPKVMAISDRDSFRLARVIQLYESGQVKTLKDKYNTGMIYLHGGGGRMYPDSAYLHTAYNLFKEINDSNYRPKLTKSLMNEAYYWWQDEIKAK